MNNKIFIDKYILSYTIIKYKKLIYLVTTPHGIFIEKNKKYQVNYNDENYMVTIYKQAYWCDLAIFKFTEKFKGKINELLILKSNPKIYHLKVENNEKKIKGFIENFVYLCYLDINGGNRILYYQLKILDGLVKQGHSGTGIYTKNKLIGIISNVTNNKAFLVPSFFILKLLNEKISDYSPYLPLKLTLLENKVIVLEKYSGLYRGFIIEKFDKLPVNDGLVYCSEIKDNIPIDVYLQMFGKLNNYIVISNNKFNYKLKIKNLNNYLKYPFISNISLKEKESLDKITFQDIMNSDRSDKASILSYNLSK